jgi:putative endonuclease
MYVGYTKDLKKRYRQHKSGHAQATKHKEWKLVYYEAYLSQDDARRREQKLKDGRAKYQLLERIAESKENAFGA